MAEGEHSGTDPKVPAERADLKKPEARAEGGAEGGTPGGPDRPGFGLSGGADRSAPQGGLSETGPVSDPTLGDQHPAGKSQLTSNKATPA